VARDKFSDRAEEAGIVLDEVMGTPESSIPEWLLDEAHCIAVIPNVVKVGFVFGGRHGRGLVSCRVDGRWSRPSFLSITGGSFGLQIGGQATDFILVFANRKAAERLTEDKFTLGGDASVAAGPVGRTASAGTDIKLQTEIYSYSRSRGLFAGLSLEGSSLATDDDANAIVYGRGTEPEDLLFSLGDVPDGLSIFVDSLARNAPGSP
jgi:lipid-binding SYLF domain-containing protein